MPRYDFTANQIWRVVIRRRVIKEENPAYNLDGGLYEGIWPWLYEDDSVFTLEIHGPYQSEMAAKVKRSHELRSGYEKFDQHPSVISIEIEKSLPIQWEAV